MRLSYLLWAATHHVDLAPLIAERIDVASRAYAKFWQTHDVAPTNTEDEQVGCEVIRDGGAQVSTRLTDVIKLTEKKKSIFTASHSRRLQV